MARAVIMVLILLVVIGYLSLFLAWNATPAPITTLQAGESKYTQDLPLGLLFIVGVVVGALAMAAALWGPWKAMKASDEQQRALVERAKAKLKSQSKEIKALTEEIEAHEGQPAEAETPSSDEVPLSPEEAAAVKATEEKPTTEADREEGETDDDPEVV
jgi:uncharacterized integral membrane protein